MFKILRILLNEVGSTLSITRTVSNTLITASGFNSRYDEIEAVVNALTADNLGSGAVTAVKLNADVVRADYGLKQHTDSTLMVDVSDTNPSLELTDGGLRVKVYGMINRTSNGLTFGRTGDVIFSSSSDTPDGWTDVSATYANEFIRVSATALSTGGSDTHAHGSVTGSHTLTIAEMPAHTHSGHPYGSGAAETSSQRWSSGDGSSKLSSDSTGGGGGHTHSIASADNVPVYRTLKMYQKS